MKVWDFASCEGNVFLYCFLSLEFGQGGRERVVGGEWVFYMALLLEKRDFGGSVIN